MLTDNLIKLIHEGKAEFKNYALGGSGVGFLQVPKNHYIVITNFVYNHFIDTALSHINTIDDAISLSNNALHTVIFKSGQNSRYMWNFRTNIFMFPFIENTIPATAGVNFFSPSNDAENIDCYQVHTENLSISILKFNPLAGWAINMGLNSDKSNSDKSPTGYGNVTQGGFNAVQEIIFSAGGAQYVPLSDASTVAPTPTYKNQMRDDVSATTALNKPSRDLPISGIYSFPVVNISYVLVKIPFINSHE